MDALNELEIQATAADTRARKARAEAARLRREIDRVRAVRVIERERLVGAAVLAWCASDDRVRASTVRYLRDRLTEDSDRALLIGSVLDVGAATDLGPAPEAGDVG